MNIASIGKDFYGWSWEYAGFPPHWWNYTATGDEEFKKKKKGL